MVLKVQIRSLDYLFAVKLSMIVEFQAKQAPRLLSTATAEA